MSSSALINISLPTVLQMQTSVCQYETKQTCVAVSFQMCATLNLKFISDFSPRNSAPASTDKISSKT